MKELDLLPDVKNENSSAVSFDGWKGPRPKKAASRADFPIKNSTAARSCLKYGNEEKKKDLHHDISVLLVMFIWFYIEIWKKQTHYNVIQLIFLEKKPSKGTFYLSKAPYFRKKKKAP